MSAYRSSLFWSLEKEVSEKLPQGMTAILPRLQAAAVGKPLLRSGKITVTCVVARGTRRRKVVKYDVCRGLSRERVRVPPLVMACEVIPPLPGGIPCRL